MEESSPIITTNLVEPNQGLKDKFKKFFANLKSLPVKTRSLLTVGSTLALLVLLPLMVFTVVTSRTSYFNRAASGEPTPSGPIIVSDFFTGNGSIDTSKWGFSGSTGSTASLEADKLKVSVPQGSDNVGGNDATAFPYINSQIPQLTGDFEATVDLAGISSNSGWQELKFSPSGSISIRRNKVGTTETLEVWTSPDNVPSNSTRNVYRSLPTQSDTLRVKLARVGNELLAYYFDGSTFVNIYDGAYSPLSGDGFPPSLVVEDGSPKYPPTIGYFDNYFAQFNLVGLLTSPKPFPTPSAAPTLTPTSLPSGSPYPTPVACVHSNQTVTLLPQSQSGYPGQVLTYNVSITNNNSPACGASTFYLSSHLPLSSWWAQLSTYQINLNGGATGIVQMQVQPPPPGAGTEAVGAPTLTATRPPGSPIPTPSTPPLGFPVGVEVKGPTASISASAAYILLPATPTPTPIPQTPTPTSVPIGHPVISTAALPAGRAKVKYSSNIKGYDTNPKAGLLMTITNLPSGLSNAGCKTNGSGGNSTLPSIICTIQGTPRSWGFSLIHAKLVDSFGNGVARNILLWVSPF